MIIKNCNSEYPYISSKMITLVEQELSPRLSYSLDMVMNVLDHLNGQSRAELAFNGQGADLKYERDLNYYKQLPAFKVTKPGLQDRRQLANLYSNIFNQAQAVYFIAKEEGIDRCRKAVHLFQKIKNNRSIRYHFNG